MIRGNDTLTSLAGLDNVDSIGGNLMIRGNDTLTSLTGLDNVTSIGGHLWIEVNNALTSLTGLNNLTSIGGNLLIRYCDALTSLTGLDNIDAGSIEDLRIDGNTSLSTCEVQSICDYLLAPNGWVSIQYNALGCNSQEEVEEACDPVSVDERTLSDKLLIYPNPSSTQITVELPNAPQKNAFLTIYNISSEQMLTSKITEQKTVVDVSALPDGIYFIKVADNRTVMVSKMVKK